MFTFSNYITTIFYLLNLIISRGFKKINLNICIKVIVIIIIGTIKDNKDIFK